MTGRHMMALRWLGSRWRQLVIALVAGTAVALVGWATGSPDPVGGGILFAAGLLTGMGLRA